MPSPSVLGEGPDTEVLDRLVHATGTGTPVALVDPGWPAPVRDRVAMTLAQADLGAGRLVVFTSGSTGQPRGIVRTVASWQGSVPGLTSLTGLTGDDVVGLPGPLTSSLYAYGGWHARQVGAAVVPRNRWERDRAAVTVAHLVPGRLQRLLDETARGELPRLRLVVLGGDRTSAAQRARAHSLGVRVLSYYGAAETSFVLVDRDGTGYQPFPGCRVDLRDGELWAGSPYLFERYLETEVPGPARRADGFVTVGDRARTLPDGRLDLLGRAGSVTTGGHTVHLADLDADLEGLAGVTRACAVGLPHAELGEIVAAVYVGTAEPAQLRHAARALPRPARPVRWLRVAALPVTAAGKTDREAVTRQLLARRSTVDLPTFPAAGRPDPCPPPASAAPDDGAQDDPS